MKIQHVLVPVIVATELSTIELWRLMDFAYGHSPGGPENGASFLVAKFELEKWLWQLVNTINVTPPAYLESGVEQLRAEYGDRDVLVLVLHGDDSGMIMGFE